MQQVTKYPDATFGWIDLSTDDLEGAKSFYSALFGWTAHDIPLPQGGVYTMMQLHGKDVAGMQQMQPQELESGHPPYWNSYLSVENLEASVQKAEAAGATIVAPPFDVMDSGRMAVLRDPADAFFSLWEAKSHIGAQLVNIPGTLCWNELLTKDPEKAGAFYQEAFGWTVTKDEDSPSSMPYYTFSNRGRLASGMMQMAQDWGDMPPHWGIYFAVDDCQAAVAKTRELGGHVIMPPTEIAEMGTFAVLQDPQSGWFNVIQMERADPMP